jgi:hypothetical protein
VVSPFIVLWWALTRWRSAGASASLASTAAIVAVGSAAAYGVRSAWAPRAQGAFVFVIVPPIACLITVVAAVIGRGLSRPGR